MIFSVKGHQKKEARPDRQKLRELEDFAEEARKAHSDVLGSYTGNPLADDIPVQDADDL